MFRLEYHYSCCIPFALSFSIRNLTFLIRLEVIKFIDYPHLTWPFTNTPLTIVETPNRPTYVVYSIIYFIIKDRKSTKHLVKAIFILKNFSCFIKLLGINHKFIQGLYWYPYFTMSHIQEKVLTKEPLLKTKSKRRLIHF